ncbi:hypothetical protein ASC64_05465 [Nocardioides sp. Root122]|nr:hypothetical protein ASC64_05465 [Nocardioides sp. Root122]
MYVPAHVEPTVDQRIVEAGAVLPAYGGVTGWAALAWSGGTWFHGRGPDGTPVPVPLAIGSSRIRPQSGIQVTSETLGMGDLEVVDGLAVTSLLWALAWELRHASDARRAVAIADMAAYSDLVSRAELERWAAAMLPQTGVDKVRAAVEHMDENSWSWQETALRLVWVLDAGLDRPLCNAAIFDRFGQHLATCDLLDVETGLAIEYNGHVHDGRPRADLDRQRTTLLEAHGITMITVVEANMQDRGALAEMLYDAREEARRVGPSVRPWTLDQPSWWVPTETVADRRALSTQQRARLLAHRTGDAA